MTAGTPALRVRGLGVAFAGARAHVLDGVDLTLERGAAIGIAGPSGSGKTTLALALLGLLPAGAAVTPGTERWLGPTRLDALGPAAWPTVRGRRLAMVFQEPLLALHPAMSVGAQIAEAGRLHGLAADEATDRMREGLDVMGFDAPERIAARYPHELSGGQRQRVLLAMAMLLRPEVLIADEPTTALDPARRDAVLDALDALRGTHGTAILLISHDVALLHARCDAVHRLADGRLTPLAVPARADASAPAAPAAPAAPNVVAPLLRVEDLHVGYGADDVTDAGATDVLAGVSLTLARGEVLGVIGPSGTGKTTLAQAILQLIPARRGRVVFDGIDLATCRGEPLRRLRRRLQYVAQDAGASLPAHRSAVEAVAEGLLVHQIARGAAARAQARALLDEVGFPAARATARIATLSSGERQRVAIARALGPGPDLLVCDEPTASLDGARREQVLALLERLRDTRGLALLLISHDHAAIARLAPRVLPL